MVIWYIIPLWYVLPKKIWQPWLTASKMFTTSSDFFPELLLIAAKNKDCLSSRKPYLLRESLFVRRHWHATAVIVVLSLYQIRTT
jgi:hypothetical protein